MLISLCALGMYFKYIFQLNLKWHIILYTWKFFAFMLCITTSIVLNWRILFTRISIISFCYPRIWSKICSCNKKIAQNIYRENTINFAFKRKKKQLVVYDLRKNKIKAVCIHGNQYNANGKFKFYSTIHCDSICFNTDFLKLYIKKRIFLNNEQTIHIIYEARGMSSCWIVEICRIWLLVFLVMTPTKRPINWMHQIDWLEFSAAHTSAQCDLFRWVLQKHLPRIPENISDLTLWWE